MKSGPMRRVAWVLVVYVPVAWFVVKIAGWFGRVLALPQLFDTLLLGLVVLGVPVAIAVAPLFRRRSAKAEDRSSLKASTSEQAQRSVYGRTSITG